MKEKVKILLIALTALCVVSFAAFAETLVVKGSTTVLPIAQACAEEFMDDNPQINISVQGGGSGVGIASLIDGACDIANASRPIKDKEIDKAVTRGVSPKAYVVAMDGIAVIVNPSNSVRGLSRKDLKAIYTGKISQWSQLGGNNGKIIVISRDSASGTFEAFGNLALNKAKVRADALQQASNQAVATTVAKTPGAIGYVGLGCISPGVKAVTIDGVDASKETVLSNQYPLSRPLFMYTNGKAAGAAEKFIDFVLSSEGQYLAEDNGYVGLQ